MEITGKGRRGNVLLGREGGWKYRQRGEVGNVEEVGEKRLAKTEHRLKRENVRQGRRIWQKK
jgi:hypothetical protein